MYYIVGTGRVLYDIESGDYGSTDRCMLLRLSWKVGELFPFCDNSVFPEGGLGHPLILAVASMC